MKVLITGASGFIGRHCLPMLARQGHEIVALSTKPHRSDTVDWRQGDLHSPTGARDAIASARPTHLLHLAWTTTPGQYWTTPDNIDWISASLRLVRDFQAHGGHRLVIAGTCAEYDWSHGVCSERTTPLAPTSLYGTSKHALGLMVEAFARETGISAAQARLFFLFGPHEAPARLVPSVIRPLLAGEQARCSTGTQARDFLFVEDAAAALVALLSSEATGAVNIGSGVATPVREVVLQLADRLDARSRVQFGAMPTAPGEPDRLVADVTRLTSEVGWLPSFTLAEGLEETLRWWRASSSC